ncbi:MAG TPA: GNAT family N-acetyltransferase [Candidatus Sulfotelmatobacter sp.]|jgi:CelD/BcsL family acetyltransferase involved in cellulose biosynthesis|nr:GNAT family N-acetyltransferase [Candidatus Sulfotelmatobacter sp.]
MSKVVYKLEKITKLTDTLISEWKLLWERAENANIFNSYEWFCAYDAINEKKNYVFYICYKNNSLVAILPLEQYRSFGVPVFGTLCRDHLGDTAFLMETYNGALFRYFFGSILKNKNLYLQKIDSRATAMLHQLFPDIYFSLMSVNPIIYLQKELFKNASSSSIKRIEKNIEKYANHLNYIMYSNNLQKHFESMLNLQLQSSKNARSLDIFRNKNIRDYYSSLIKYASRFIRINFIFYDNVPIAYEYGFQCGDRYSGDQISFHNKYRKFMPGKLMIYYIAKHLKQNNSLFLDQGGGIHSYKMDFTKEYRLLYNMYYSRNVFFMMWWKIINKARRLRQIVYPKKHTRDHEFLFKTF